MAAQRVLRLVDTWTLPYRLASPTITRKLGQFVETDNGLQEIYARRISKHLFLRSQICIHLRAVDPLDTVLSGERYHIHLGKFCITNVVGFFILILLFHFSKFHVFCFLYITSHIIRLYQRL
jgi:hypothetical protein